jgi:multidrug transporter EmrE-like cation transporter
LTGINFILTLMVGIFIFSERLIPIGYIGVFLIFIGVVCVSMGYGQT